MTGYGKKGLAVSLVFHSMCVIALLYPGGLRSDKKDVVVDFRVENYDRQASLQAPPKGKTIKKHIKKAAKTYSLPIEEKKVEPPVKDDGEIIEDKTTAESPPIQEQKMDENDVNNVETGGNIAASANADGGPVEDDEGKYLRINFSFIRDVVQKGLVYPKAARQMGWMGRVVVSFKVLETGHVKELEITESSGFELLDRNAVETIKKLAPFPRPPVEARIIVPIIYALK